MFCLDLFKEFRRSWVASSWGPSCPSSNISSMALGTKVCYAQLLRAESQGLEHADLDGIGCKGEGSAEEGIGSRDSCSSNLGFHN